MPTSFWGGPFTGIIETLRPTVANADEQAWLDKNQKSNAYRSFK